MLLGNAFRLVSITYLAATVSKHRVTACAYVGRYDDHDCQPVCMYRQRNSVPKLGDSVLWASEIDFFVNACTHDEDEVRRGNDGNELGLGGRRSKAVD